MMAKTICLAQSKGGTGKTSSTLNIGAALAEQGYKVLLVDTDQQANLTISLAIDPLEHSDSSMVQLLTSSGVTARQVITQTSEGLDLIPSHPDMAFIEPRMPRSAPGQVLQRKLAGVTSDYDFILIDTSPSLNIPTLNALVACQYVLVPTTPEPLCIYGLASLKATLDGLVMDGDNPDLKLIGFFVTFYDGRLKAHRDLEKQLREMWQEQIFKTLIKRRPVMLETTMEGRSILSLKTDSELAAEYRQLTREVLNRVQ